VVVNVVAKEEGVETHRISRITTATWTDTAGQQRVVQFINLQRVHRRQA
jgi:hypothetical protein